jgi:hypothetical protein
MMIAPAAGADRRLYTDRWWEVDEEQNRAAREQQLREAAEREAAALAHPGVIGGKNELESR